MQPRVLEEMTRKYIAEQSPELPEINFTWQGGEPTLMGIDFFRHALNLQSKYQSPGQRISNSIQTNGVLLDDDWGQFLHKHNFLVGLSIDGPKEMHDAYRIDQQGRGTFDKVIRGLETLERHEVEFNILTTVNQANGDHPVKVYDFLKENGVTFMQFIPIVEKDGQGGITDRSVRPEQYGKFLVGILEHWLAEADIGKVFVQDFDVLLSQVMGLGSPICIHDETCGKAVAMEHNGDLYSCDHYVRTDHRLGNIMETGMAAMLDSPMQLKFGNDKRDTLPPICLECEYLAYCRGGCPKDRLVQTPDGEPGLNYLCLGYKHFYGRALPVMEQMAKCLKWHRPASDYRVIDELIRKTLRQQGTEVGRNDPCPCGSGLKYKKCCMPRSFP